MLRSTLLCTAAILIGALAGPAGASAPLTDGSGISDQDRFASSGQAASDENVLIARHGADDPAGDDRGGRSGKGGKGGKGRGGRDDGPNHT
jgi:hypothetical protein